MGFETETSIVEMCLDILCLEQIRPRPCHHSARLEGLPTRRDRTLVVVIEEGERPLVLWRLVL